MKTTVKFQNIESSSRHTYLGQVGRFQPSLRKCFPVQSVEPRVPLDLGGPGLPAAQAENGVGAEQALDEAPEGLFERDKREGM